MDKKPTKFEFLYRRRNQFIFIRDNNHKMTLTLNLTKTEAEEMMQKITKNGWIVEFWW
jgi:hypothetical protein